MKTVRVAKAQGMFSRPPVEDVSIEIRGEIPGEGPVTNRDLFLRDALLALPGGTVDQLLVLLLQDRASQLVVPSPVPLDDWRATQPSPGSNRREIGVALGETPPLGPCCRHSAQSWVRRADGLFCEDCNSYIVQDEDSIYRRVTT